MHGLHPGFRGRAWRPIALLVWVALAPALEASGQPLSAAGTATIDGVKSPGEWDGAAVRSVFGGFPGSKLYVMNDDQNLYLGIEVLGDADLTNGDRVQARFDDDRDLVYTNYDDALSVGPSGYTDSYYATGLGWGIVDPIQNGEGAAGRSAGVNFFEVSKPLNVGDLRDFALGAGQSVGICIEYFENSAGVDDHPAGCITATDQQGYDVIEIVLVPTQPIGAYGTAVVDGTKSPGEWDGAATRAALRDFPGSTLYVMNDDQNLYLGIEVLGDLDLTSTDSAHVRFDNEHDLMVGDGDDEAWQQTNGYSDRHYASGSWGNLDTEQNGQGAIARAGGVNFIEISKPLDSGDPQDFSRAVGDQLGLCVIYFEDNTATSGTNHPYGCAVGGQQDYDIVDIVAKPPVVPALSPSGVLALGLVLLGSGFLVRRRRSR